MLIVDLTDSWITYKTCWEPYRKSSAIPVSWKIWLMFSTSIFRVFALTWRFLIHLIISACWSILSWLVCRMRATDLVSLCNASGYQFSWYWVVKRLFFLNVFFDTLSKIRKLLGVGLSMGTRFCDINLCVCFCAGTTIQWYGSIVWPEVGYCAVPALLFFLGWPWPPAVFSTSYELSFF